MLTRNRNHRKVCDDDDATEVNRAATLRSLHKLVLCRHVPCVTCQQGGVHTPKHTPRTHHVSKRPLESLCPSVILVQLRQHQLRLSVEPEVIARCGHNPPPAPARGSSVVLPMIYAVQVG